MKIKRTSDSEAFTLNHDDELIREEITQDKKTGEIIVKYIYQRPLHNDDSIENNDFNGVHYLNYEDARRALIKKQIAEGRKNLETLLQRQKKATDKYRKKIASAKFNSTKEEENIVPENPLGERIEFLLKQNNQEIADVARSIGIGRSSMHRYIKGTHTPSMKKLEAIINALLIDADDFAYFPEDNEKWKDSLVPSDDARNIFEFKENVLVDMIFNRYIYTSNGKICRVPNKYFSLLRKYLQDAFEVLELLPHDDLE